MREIIDAMYFGQGSYTMMITRLNDKVIVRPMRIH